MSDADGARRWRGDPAATGSLAASGHMALGPGREFDLVRSMSDIWGSAATGLGDDCAVLNVSPGEQLVATTDTTVEQVHFRREWLDPAEVGWRATAGAVSDLAAAAATPLGIMLAMVLPDDWRESALRIADGVGQLSREVGIPIVGGDLARGDRLVLTVTALGSAARPLLRSGASPGDRIFVTGRFGGPALAIASWLNGQQPAAADRERFARPLPRLREARWLAARGARAAVDISDGLAADLRHIAHASGSRVILDADRVPRATGADWRVALGSGEEYELAVALPGVGDAATGSRLIEDFREQFGLELTEVARVEEGAPDVWVERAGDRVDLPPGYDHFST